MTQTGQRDDAVHDGEAGSSTAGATGVSRSSKLRGPGDLTIAELMRVQDAEQPRSMWARLFGANPVAADSEQLFARALGERAVGELLSQLGKEWTVLHSVPVGGDGARFDHLVVGPAGVFTITTRNHPGLDVVVSGQTVLVAGTKVAHIRAAEHDLGRAERLLGAALGESIAVCGLLVFVAPESLTLRNVPRDVQVLESSELLPWLEVQPDVFDVAELERIVRTAESPAVWGAPEEVGADSEHDELATLVRLVERSRMLRQLWFGAATILIVVTATALATLVVIGAAPNSSR